MFGLFGVGSNLLFTNLECKDRKSEVWSPYTWLDFIRILHRLPITIHRSPFTNHHSPITDHHSPITIHRSPFTDHHSPI